ncbi:MAG: heterodisulfide reductase [Gemmatimonadales bacterium]|nr:heterodisulfide reductase [Gemmatimonadales bacterium]
MSEAQLLKPDRQFVEEIVASGGSDLKKCYQCATCSVVCGLSVGRTPFPRKEMIWAQWGLRDRLVADPDIWLCHQCNDCSTKCPRGARPGDVLAAVRQQAVQHYAVPGLLGTWVNRVKYLPLMLLVPVVLLALVLALREPLEGMLPVGAPHGFYAEFFPHWLLIGFFSLFTGLAFLAAVTGAVRFWRAMKTADESSGRSAAALGVLPSVIRTLKSILSHHDFGECTSQASRRWAHLLTFYGFVALFMVTVWAVLDLYINPYVLGIDSSYPFGLLHPMKILANVGAVVLIVGCVKAIADRRRSKADSAASTPFDWIFIWLLLSVATTGVLTEVFRFIAEPSELVGLEYAAFAVYFVHLVLVFGLLVYLPYSKFAHMLYRTVALVYAERSGRSQEARRVEQEAHGGRQSEPQADQVGEAA